VKLQPRFTVAVYPDRRAKMMRAAISFWILAAACGDNLSPPGDEFLPDAAVEVVVDAEVPVDAPADAAPDAPPDAPVCWMRLYPQCGNEVYEICIPFGGCASFTCGGETYSYCSEP
jgi:hypothetical protein